MDKDFSLDKVGKRMPYTTPEGFLDQLEANVWQEVKADMNMHQTSQVVSFVHRFYPFSCSGLCSGSANDSPLCSQAIYHSH